MSLFVRVLRITMAKLAARTVVHLSTLICVSIFKDHLRGFQGVLKEA